MFIASGKIYIHLAGINSLKDKRRIVKSVIERLKSRFNVSVAEVDRQDNKQMAVIGIAVVSGDKIFAQTQLNKALNFVHNDGRFYVGKIDSEIFPAF
jgi:uncharacterized protein